MNIQFAHFELKTTGGTDILDITHQVESALREMSVRDGLITVFIPGSTAAVSTIEYESGVIDDLKRAIEELVPKEKIYKHDARWGDGNGYSHVRAALLKPSLTIPVKNGEMLLGTWQQIVLLDFDNKPRNRRIIVQGIG